MRFLHFGQKTTNMSILDMIGSDMGNFIFSEPYNPYDRTANLGVKMAPSQRDPPAAYSETKVNSGKSGTAKTKKKKMCRFICCIVHVPPSRFSTGSPVSQVKSRRVGGARENSSAGQE